MHAFYWCVVVLVCVGVLLLLCCAAVRSLFVVCGGGGVLVWFGLNGFVGWLRFVCCVSLCSC